MITKEGPYDRFRKQHYVEYRLGLILEYSKIIIKELCKNPEMSVPYVFEVSEKMADEMIMRRKKMENEE